MKKQNLTHITVLYAITALFLAACLEPLGTTQRMGAADTGRVIVSIAGADEAPAPEAADSPGAGAARTLLPEYGVLTYKVDITRTGETSPVITQTITETSVAADLEAGTYTVSVTATNSDNALVAGGSGTVAISLGVESPVTIRLASVVSGTGTFAYTVSLTLPGYVSFKSGSIALHSLSGGTSPSPVDLTGVFTTGTLSLPAGFYRAVLAVEVLGKRVAKTQIIHISKQTTTGVEFDLAIGDFVPSPPAGGSVIYITTQAELAAIRDHIGDGAMNYGKNAYVLLNDIALSGIWTPIGNKTDGFNGTDWQYAFQGYFFGENHRITGLALPNPGASLCTGFFGAAYKALIQDLTVETAAATHIELDQKTFHYIGFVAGLVSESELFNITVKPANLTVEKKDTATASNVSFGGVAGEVRASRLRGSAVVGASGSSLSFFAEAGNTAVWTTYIGGIAGSLAGSSEISESAVSLDVNISQPDISLNSYVGGIAGSNSGTIRQSSYSGTFYLSFAGVSPFANTGGIAGENTGTIETCYAAPVITINTDTTSGQHYLYTGGLAGANTGTLRNSYAACEIGITVTTTSAGTKNIYSGGVAGSRGQSASSGGAIEKCYAAGSLQISINGTINSYDLIRSSGISNDADSVSLSAALLSAITSKAGASSAGTYSRIAPMGTLTGNIAFNNMLVNDAALSDAVTDPQDDANGLGKTATELASQSTYAGLGWDFTGVWEMGPAEYPYPVLQRQTGMPPADFALPED